MAAYGALVSVLNIIDQIQTHPCPPISIHQKQLESLIQAVTSLQNFLESYSPHGGYTEEEDIWESRIAEAAYDAEDVIESYIVDQIRLRSRCDVETISSIQFYQDLQKVIENMNLIKIEIKEKLVVQDQPHIIKSLSTAAALGSSRSTSTAHNVPMIGFDDVLLQMLDKITRGEPDLQILPIVGMGGIGKTTLAQTIYVSPLVRNHFDVCAWSTISQEYNAEKILRQVLDLVDIDVNRVEARRYLSEDDLELQLYRYLIGRRYFIVMDDMWNIEAWDQVRRFFPDNRDGSRIVVTTRLSNLASLFNYSNGLDMKFLDEYASWNLFSKIVFGDESCPYELENIGKKIVKGCRGLPLSLAVIGGLLSKSEKIEENWGFIEKNLSSIVNMDDNQKCLQVLHMSYNNLPVHLKPCFLYMGRYGEDEDIVISDLIQLSVAEGFVKPINGKCLEDVAKEYIYELLDRNLLIVGIHSYSLKMHDLVRDLCLREAQKLKFLCVLKEHSIPQDIQSQRRIVGRLSEEQYPTPLLQSLESASLLRSLTLGPFDTKKRPTSLLYNFRLLRVGYVEQDYEDILPWLVNLRFLDVYVVDEHPLPSSIYFLWNLRSLLLHNVSKDYVCEIWKMPQLRHVGTYLREGTLDGAYCLPNTSFSDEEDMVLENLQTLSHVKNLKFGEIVLKRIPNIKTLKLYYKTKVDTSGEDSSSSEESFEAEDSSSYEEEVFSEGGEGDASKGKEEEDDSEGEGGDASEEEDDSGGGGGGDASEEEDASEEDSGEEDDNPLNNVCYFHKREYLQQLHKRTVEMLGEDSSEEEEASGGEEDEYHLNNVCCLHNLENLQLWCSSQNTSIIRQVSFPHSLKKLTLRNTYLRWEDMKTKIGSLPVLQVLKLKKNSFIGSKWETVEEQFLNLKLLLIEDCDVERWITDDAHFPRLEHLHLRYVERLREIPLCVGDISTLQTIMLEDCSNAVMDSAQKIKDEQQECGNEDLQISVA